MNEVKIVVSGQNRFAATQATLVKQLQGVKSAAGGASTEATALAKAVEKPKTTAVDKVTRSLDKTKASAKGAADELGKIAGKAPGAAKIADAITEAGKSADALAKRIERVGQVTERVATRMPLRTVWRDAVSESSAAMDELVLTLYRAGSEAGSALYQALKLDRVQARLTIVGDAAKATLNRALEPARRARAVMVSAADTIASAWAVATGKIDAAVAATRRAAATTMAAAMVPVRRTRTIVVETSAAIADAVGRGVDRAQARATAAADSITAAWTRASDRVAARARAMSEAATGAFNRVVEPARVAGARAVEAAERAKAAWDRASEPVIRYGRAVADVASTTVRLAGRIVAPFGRVGAAIGGVVGDAVGDAAHRGSQAFKRGVDSALDSTLASVRSWGGRVVSVAESTWEAAGKKADAMVKGVAAAGNKLVDAVDRSFSALPNALQSPALMGAIAAAALPIGAAAGGAIVLGLGLGLAGAGVITAARTGEVRQRWQEMARGVSRDWQEVTTPFRETTMTIIGDMEQAFGTLKPKLQRSFANLAPGMSDLSKGLFEGLGDFDAFEPLSRAAGKVMSDLGGRMPRIVGNLSDSFTDLARSIEKNPKALGQFVEGLTGVAGHVISDLGTINEEFAGITEEIEMFRNLFDGRGYRLDSEITFKRDPDMQKFFEDMAGGAEAASRSTYQARDSAERLESAWRGLADAGDDVAKRGQGIVQMLDVLSGRTPSFEESQQRINDSIRGLEETFSDSANWVNGYGDALIKADGTVNTVTANGSMLYSTIQDLKGGFADAAASIRDLEDAGWSHDEAVQKVNDDMRVQYDRLLANAGQMGLTRGQMQDLLNTYSLTPKFLDTIARLDENGIRAKLDMLAYTRTVIFRGVLDASQIPNGRSPDARAHGGVSGGGWTTVGELGPERVKLPPGAQVQPYTASRRQLEPAGLGTGMGGTGPGLIQLLVNSSGSKVDDFLAEIIRKYVRIQGGGSVQAAFGGRT